jgi:alpha-L-fucosidase
VDGSTKNIPEYAKQKPFEEIRGIGRSFGYNRAENLEDYQSSEALVHMLVELVSKGGNLLLDVGPTADGRIPVIMQQRLADIGGWLKVNGEAIYGTRKWLDAPDKKPEHVFYTSKGNDIYVICTTFPETSIELECTKKPLGVSMLGYGGKIQYSCIGKILSIKPPAITPASNPCNYAWVFKVEGAF